MTDGEIRDGIRWLLENPQSPWRNARKELARVLGYESQSGLASLKSKLRNSWIYPSEREHLLRQVRRVLAGELVPVIPKQPNGRRSTRVPEKLVAIGPRPPIRMQIAWGPDGVTLKLLPRGPG